LIEDKLFIDTELSPLLREYRSILSPQVSSLFDPVKTENKLKEFYEVKSLASYGKFTTSEISACGSLIEYVELTQKGVLPRLNPPQKFSSKNFMQIDASTRRNLELTSTLSGDKKGSLLSIIDRTITAAGSRLQLHNLTTPYTNSLPINNKLDGVQFFIENENIRHHVRETLKRVPDIERALSRICIGKGGPKDLVAIRDGLSESTNITEIIEFSGADEKPNIITNKLKDFSSHDYIINKLQESLKQEVGVLARDGGYVKTGYHHKLDEFRELRDNGRDKVTQLRDVYREETGINNLKISQNGVLGYFVEVTPNQSSKVTDDKFNHRQTLASAIRYSTDELRQLESNIINARDEALKLELVIFDELVQDIKHRANEISVAAQSIAQLDVLAALAQAAVENNYTRPHVDESTEFNIKGGRHPVVEANINGELDSEFISNNVNLTNDQRLWLLTGPNMAGKSTYLRQNAIIALMAQIGSYVPADDAHIGCIDKLFSRVGASDDLARGQSTFMVEMLETATILNQATARSLVILDEIGRGTATHDGLSIAWAVVEQLHNRNKSRALFATHYHELTSLRTSLPALTCYTMKVKEWEGEVIFMHEVIPGSADRSYGIHVAKLAGIPRAVIRRAEEVLRTLQESDTGSAKTKLAEDLPLFFANNNSADGEPEPSEIEQTLQETDLDSLAPREALELLYRLKEKL
jgi:DNA mismatch repair protein MutS